MNRFIGLTQWLLIFSGCLEQAEERMAKSVAGDTLRTRNGMAWAETKASYRCPFRCYILPRYHESAAGCCATSPIAFSSTPLSELSILPFLAFFLTRCSKSGSCPMSSAGPSLAPKFVVGLSRLVRGVMRQLGCSGSAPEASKS